MKLEAPEQISHFNFDSVDYERDEDGTFDIRHPDHVKKAIRLGAKPYDPNLRAKFETPVERVPSDNDAQIDQMRREAEEAATASAKREQDKDDEIAQLRAQLADARAAAEKNAEAAGGTDAPADADDASGDTSPSSEDTAATPMAEALAANPNFEAMTRDGKVEWLAGVGISVPANISKDAAQKVIDDAIADHKAKSE